MAKDSDSENSIITRLNILVNLALEMGAGRESLAMSEKIRRLQAMGIPQSEIANIIGKPLNYVTASVSQSKKTKKGKV